MHSRFRGLIPFALALSMSAPVLVAQEVHNGWRGNGTGIWTDATPPLFWDLPDEDFTTWVSSAERVKRPFLTPGIINGLLLHWQIVGPFPVGPANKPLDEVVVPHESELQPRADADINGQCWQKLSITPEDILVLGTAELPWLDVGKALQAAPNQVAYAHTWIWSPCGGEAEFVFDHTFGMRAWLDGREVYCEPGSSVKLGYYSALGRRELEFADARSSRFRLHAPGPGWHRLLLKLSSGPIPDQSDMRVAMRLGPPRNNLEETSLSERCSNIAFITELPGRSTSTPILVGDRLFVMCEPDELVCIDKLSGRILWNAFVNTYEAVPAAVKQADRRFSERVDPLISQLHPLRVPREERFRLRREIQQTLREIDPDRFTPVLDGHFESHFGIVGYTMPTPVSDGKLVYVWSVQGIAACFDLEGNHRWITQVPERELAYGSSPALADGVLAVFQKRLYGIDAQTGKILWDQSKIHKNVASLLAARLSGQSLFVTQQGELLRPSTGELLYRPRGLGSGDTGWAPPQILGETVCLPKFGVAQLNFFDFSGVENNRFQERQPTQISMDDGISKLPDGRWIDRWSPGSPVVWKGLCYMVDIHQNLYVTDINEGKMLYRQQLPLNGFTHYNAVAVAASPTLIGEHLFICDNQGSTVVLKPGREYEEVACNQIRTQLVRDLPLPAQETLAYAPPIADEGRLYLRGERYLYCIAEHATARVNRLTFWSAAGNQ